MNKKVKKKWLKALRSGEYKQGNSYLRIDDTFCCLGVLCDIHSKETNRNWQKSKGEYRYVGRPYDIPDIVLRWAGLSLANVGDNYRCVAYKGKKKHLAAVNDDGYSFKQIANIIESQL